MNYGRLNSAFRDAGSGFGSEPVIWNEEFRKAIVVGTSIELEKCDVPKPVLAFEEPENFPFPGPSLTGLNLTRLGEVEQIPQVSLIVRLFPANVHGDSLKPSELI